VAEVGAATHAAERHAVELVGLADHAAAVAQRAVGDRAAVVVVIAAAVEVTAVALGDETFHREDVVRVAVRRVAGALAGRDVAAAEERDVAPFAGGGAPRAGPGVAAGRMAGQRRPGREVVGAGEDDRVVLRALHEELGAPRTARLPAPLMVAVLAITVPAWMVSVAPGRT
jgi:hypothetical protein